METKAAFKGDVVNNSGGLAAEEVVCVADLEIGLDSLTEQQRELFVDLVPAELETYATFEEFRQDYRNGDLSHTGTYNFVAGLVSGPGNIAGDIFRQRPAYQRASLLCEDVLGFSLDELESEMAGFEGGFSRLDTETQLKLYQLYNLMSKLVSVYDPHVLRQHNGTQRLKVDQDYLRH